MISTHVLDTSKGLPASGISVKLQKTTGTHFDSLSSWENVAQGITNADGRINFDCEKNPGIYKLTFELEDYLKSDHSDFFFIQAPVIFKIENVNRKYHVPLLLNPFGYSTYRGS
jgi:5-hydroxyisourate hydrolase